MKVSDYLTTGNLVRAFSLAGLVATTVACAPLPNDPRLARQVGEAQGGLIGAVGGALIGEALDDSGIATGIGAATGTYYGRRLGGAYAEAQAREAGACRETRTQQTDYLTGRVTSDRGTNRCTRDTGYPAP